MWRIAEKAEGHYSEAERLMDLGGHDERAKRELIQAIGLYHYARDQEMVNLWKFHLERLFPSEQGISAEWEDVGREAESGVVECLIEDGARLAAEIDSMFE